MWILAVAVAFIAGMPVVREPVEASTDFAQYVARPLAFFVEEVGGKPDLERIGGKGVAEGRLRPHAFVGKGRINVGRVEALWYVRSAIWEVRL